MNKARQVWLAIHKYLGLTIGVVVLLNALSGSALVYYREFVKIGVDDLQSVPSSTVKLPLAELATTLSRSYSDRTLFQVKHRGMGPESPVVAIFTDSDGSQTEMFFDPYNGQLRSERPAGDGVMGVMIRFHADFLLGRFGRYVVAVLGAVMFVSIITGLVLWWPRPRYFRRAFRIIRRSPRFWVHLHSIPSVYTVVVVLLLAISGFVLVLPEWFEAPPNAMEQSSQATHEHGGVLYAVAVAGQMFPDAELYSLQFPPGDSATIVRLKVAPRYDYSDDKTVAVASSGRILWVRDHNNLTLTRRWFDIYSIGIHSGQIAGAGGRVLVFVTGICFGLSSVLGFVIYFRNRRLKSRHKITR